jgi:ABC-type multidrug transport system fused ATPase/permease subunit
MRPDADLYVFDEANSALDAAAQNELFERITRGCVTTKDGQTRRKTVIFVTHRLSTVRRADKSTYAIVIIIVIISTGVPFADFAPV